MEAALRSAVVVTLAEKRQTLSRIVELAPGSIIHFDKSCEDPVELHVNGQRIAIGETVKVGQHGPQWLEVEFEAENSNWCQ